MKVLPGAVQNEADMNTAIASFKRPMFIGLANAIFS
jgi:hypothetical protein